MFYELALLLLIGCFASSYSEDSDNWSCYLKQKCFQVLDINTPQTYEEAEASCAKLDSNATLPTVHSKDEQDFLVNYLFKSHSNSKNYWLGARVENNISYWTDQSEFDYENWHKTPSAVKKDRCVQIKVDKQLQGKWSSVKCTKKNPVVCQKVFKLGKDDEWIKEEIDKINSRIEELTKEDDDIWVAINNLSNQKNAINTPNSLNNKKDKSSNRLDRSNKLNKKCGKVFEKKPNDQKCNNNSNNELTKLLDELKEQVNELKKQNDELNKRVNELSKKQNNEENQPNEEIENKFNELDKTFLAIIPEKLSRVVLSVLPDGAT